MSADSVMYEWGHSRRINAYGEYTRKIFGTRVQKLSLDVGFSCPNRDGSIAEGGCTFCNGAAFSPSYCIPEKSIRQQLNEGIEFHQNRYRQSHKYMAYFQAYSNTHASLDKLRQLYAEALSVPGVVGMVIGTRPDCIDGHKLDFLATLAEKYYVIVEYGIESCYDKTLALVNRGHSFEQAVWALQETAQRNIKTGAHFMIGLPGESREEIMAQTQIIGRLPLDNIKFHQLQILKNTPMHRQFIENPEAFELFTLDEYIDFITEYISYLPPSLVIERFTAEVPPRYLVAPDWGLIRAGSIVGMIEKALETKNLWQGCRFDSKSGTTSL
jgi:uncharacterized protein